MIGEITSLDNGPQRNVKIVISPTEVFSEISSPAGSYHPMSIDYYEIAGMHEGHDGLATLALVLTDCRKVLFYSTYSQFDLALLLDQLDGTIGVRRREGFKP